MTRRRGAVLFLAAILVASGGPGWAQGGLSGFEIKGLLEASARYLRASLDQLDAPAQALALSGEAYIQVRAAHEKMRASLVLAKFPDPLYQMAVPQLESARNHVLFGRAALQDPGRVVGGTPTEVARNRLTQALRLIELVLLTTF